jgi:hypothetical protein
MGYRQVDIKPPGFDELIDTGGRGAFGGGEHQHDSIFLPGSLPLCIDMASPDINHRVTAVIYGAGCADFPVLLKVIGKGISHRFKARLEATIHLALIQAD